MTYSKTQPNAQGHSPEGYSLEGYSPENYGLENSSPENYSPENHNSEKYSAGYSSDPVFQAIQQIRNPAALEPILLQTWEHWLGNRPQAIRVVAGLTYYRPFDCAHIVAEMTVVPEEGAEAIRQYLFLNVFADAEAVRQQVEQGYELAVPPNAALPVFAITEWQTVVWTLPHAPCLAQLAGLLQPEYFCPLLVSPEDLPARTEAYPAPKLFRYVPFKRAILTWDSPSTQQRYFTKLCTEKEFAQVVDSFQRVYQLSEQFSFRVPEPVAVDVQSRTFSMKALPGQQFTDVMRQTQPQPFGQVGKLLAELHRAELHPIKTWTPAKELETFSSAMAEVKLALPHLGGAIDRLVSQLIQMTQNLTFLNGYPIHANLFGDQILYDSDQMGLVDWDTLSLGDPHYDVGRLIAHFLYLAGRERLPAQAVRTCVDALLQGYEAEATWRLNRTCLIWHVATQLLLRGKISSLRKLPSDWQNHLEFVVAETEWLLAGCSEFMASQALFQKAG